MNNSWSWQINPSTGDYVLKGGSPVIDRTVLTPAYIRLKTPRTKWLYAPDDQYGSDFYKSHIRAANSVFLMQYANAAIQPIVTTGRAQSVATITTAYSRGTVNLQSTIMDSSGVPQVLNFNPVGGV